MAPPDSALNFMPILAKFAMLRDANHRAFNSVQNALSSAVNPPLIGPQSRWHGEHDYLRVGIS
jgi:hypothetical protein